MISPQGRHPEKRAGRLTRPVVWVWRCLMGLACSALLGWMTLAIHFDFSLLGPPWLHAGVDVLVPVGALVALWLVRPRRWVFAFVVADERDVVRLRTNYRGEGVYVYRLDVPPADARVLLLRHLQEVNRLRERSQWYNALTDNCTTAIQRLARSGERWSWWSWSFPENTGGAARGGDRPEAGEGSAHRRGQVRPDGQLRRGIMTPPSRLTPFIVWPVTGP